MTRRSVVVAGLSFGVGLLALSAIGPLLRARVNAEALRRGVVLHSGSVQPIWGGVRLSGVSAALVDVPNLQVRVDELRVGVNVLLHLDSIELDRGSVTLTGPADELREALQSWGRRYRSGSSAASGRTRSLHLAIRDGHLRWDDGNSTVPRMDIGGIEADLSGKSMRIGLSDAAIRLGSWAATLSQARLQTRPDGSVERARCTSGVVEWMRPEKERPPQSLHTDARPAFIPGAEPAAPDTTPLLERGAKPPSTSAGANRAIAPGADPKSAFVPGSEAKPAFVPGSDRAAPSPGGAIAKVTPAAKARAGAMPLDTGSGSADEDSAAHTALDFPNLQRVQAEIHALTRVFSEIVPASADIGIDALTWKISHPHERAAFSIGPGPLTVRTSDQEVEVHFSTDPSLATTPLALRCVLPTDGGDVSLTLDGGPISLQLLGIPEGAAGLVDVRAATFAGRAKAVLAADGTSLTVDAQGATHGLSIDNPRLAPDVVRDLDMDLRARGVLSEGSIRLDDFAATLGALSLTAGGAIDQDAEHVAGTFRFEIAPARCQALLESVPVALLPDLRDTKMDGTFAASGRVSFDSRALDDLSLVYDIGDRCRIVGVPAWLSRDQYEHAFTQKIYLPDGTISEQETGPGTPNWTSLDEISPYMQLAVLTTEDGAFPRHHGFNRASIRSALIANLKARRFVRGASTITMQLAKNLFLSREKTLSRKLEEVVLTEYLEQSFSKSELMELYLNVIEFGPAVYGVTAAADYYFGRTPAELNLAESLFLSSLLPSPRRYGLMRDHGSVTDGWMRTLHTLMEIAHKNGRISDAELAEGEAESIVFWNGTDERPSPRPPVTAHPWLKGESDLEAPAPIQDGP